MIYNLTANLYAVARNDLHIDLIDLALLRVLEFAFNCDELEYKRINNKPFFWVSHALIKNQMPILEHHIKSKRGLRNRMQNLEDAKLILRRIENRQKTLYARGENWTKLISSEPKEPSLSSINEQKGSASVCRGGRHLYADNNIKRDNILKKEKDKKERKGGSDPSQIIEARQKKFAQLWEMFGHKRGKAQAVKAFEKLKQEDWQKVEQGIRQYKKHLASLKDKAPTHLHFATFINQKRYDDEYPTTQDQSLTLAQAMNNHKQR